MARTLIALVFRLEPLPPYSLFVLHSYEIYEFLRSHSVI